jgi:3-deoxy-D-arabino-heptulosonate 7-phosphate (DAHP) synthase
LNQTVDAISKTNKVDVIRAGVWKSRTRPGTFQGVGKEAFKVVEKHERKDRPFGQPQKSLPRKMWKSV